MQGNKKHTEGHSDSSSIGSLLDETDREVSSLTDRAFKSLCVAELEDPCNEPDLAISPDFALQFSAKFHPGTLNHAIKKNNICNKLTTRNNEHTIWASTFQQLPKHASEEKRIAKDNTFATERKNLNLPVPGLRKNKHVSKVSSLIKTFDKTADQGSEGSLTAIKQPTENSFQKRKLNHGNDMAFWDGTDILSNHKELPEFSEASQGSQCLSGKHEPQKGPNKIDLSYCGSDDCYPMLIEMSKVAKSNFSHSSKKALKTRSVKVNEPAKKGSFLHSENSAFESWNVHHKKLTEKEEFDVKMEGLTYQEEAPFIKGSHTSEHELPPSKTAVAKKQKKGFQMKPDPPEDAFSIPLPAVCIPQSPLPSETRFPATLPPTPPPRTHVHQGPPPRPPPVLQVLPLTPSTPQSHPPTPPTSEAAPVLPQPMPAQLSPPALSQASISPQSMSYRMVSPSPESQAPSSPPPRPLATLTKEEALSPQPANNTCPPWRRQRATKGAAEKRQISKEKFTPSDETYSLSEKVTDAEPGLDVTPLDKQVNPPGSISPSFNITELLTPIIPPKQEPDAVESELIPLTPPPTESVSSRDHEGSTFDDYRSRDSYKSKASSLLFNLKDVRKRVRRIYTPSPLLRALEEKSKTRESIRKSTKMNASLSTLQEKSNKNIPEKDESSDITSVLSGSVQKDDNKTDFTGHFTDNYLTLSSPQTTADLSFYQAGDNLQQDDSKHKDLVKNTGDNENFPLFKHESNEPDLRKHLQYPTRKPFSRDNTDTTTGQPMQNPGVQAEENERQAAVQNENIGFKTLQNQLLPADDVPYGDTQTNMLVPGHEVQGKNSTSSSEQSFVSTVEQPLQEEPFPTVPLMQKACLQESQRTKSEMGANSTKSHKERGKDIGEDEPQYLCGTSASEKMEEKVTGNEERSLMTEKLREKSEEVKSMDSASDSLRDMSIPSSEEPQTPLSSNSNKPCLFMIKDNTFRSPQIIRAVKLPLFRSFSLDDTVSRSYKEMESRFMPLAEHNKQHQNMLHTQEVGWLALRHRGQQNVRDRAANRGKEANESGSTSATMDPNLLEDTESTSSGKLMEDDEETCASLNKVGKMKEESVYRRKEKPQTRKARHSLTQPNLGLENDQAQNNPSYPADRKTNYFKNHHLSNRRGGSCVKKIITREIISPVAGSISEDHTYSPVSHEASEDILHTEGEPLLLDSLVCSAATSPRSGSTMHSIAASSSSDKTISGLREIEDVINPALMNMALKSQAEMSAEEVVVSARRNQLSDSAEEAERLEPRGLREKAAGKPPVVPPKTEKALRRAKKLASRRKKLQEQQKKHQTEHTDAVGRKPSHSGQTLASSSALGYSPLHPAPHSAFTPTESNAGRASGASAVSPSPSSTQRKLLQDPDSGQYYLVDLPAEVNLKTFYDPETGKYVQVSVPSLERIIYQPPSSEILNSSCVPYPRVLPLPASSVAVLKSPSQLSEPTWLMPAVPGEQADLPEDGQQDYTYTGAVDSQPYIESGSYSYRQDAEENQVHLGKDMSPTPNTDIVSLTDLDDFADEGVS